MAAVNTVIRFAADVRNCAASSCSFRDLKTVCLCCVIAAQYANRNTTESLP